MRIVLDLLLLLFFAGVLCSPVALGYLCVNPALPANYNADSPAGTSIAFGLQDTTIPTAAGNTSPVVYTTNGMTLTFDSDVTESRNSAARPARQKAIPKIPEGELELQANGNNAPLPYLFAEFTLQDTLNGASYIFWVQRIVHGMVNDGSVSKCTILARWKLNG